MKTAKTLIAVSGLYLLGACTTSVSSVDPSKEPGTLTELPEGLVANAAPNQDLSSVRIDPEDGCYWFRWAGPVETTYLPLRAKNGQPICSRPQDPPPTPTSSI